MRLLASAQPNDVLCPAFQADIDYYLTLTNLEHMYWNRPPLSKKTCAEFRKNLQGTTFTVEWRCSTVRKLPSLVILSAERA